MLHINLALIGHVVSEKMIFENGGRRRRRTPDHGHPISSPCQPNGSGELIGEFAYYSTLCPGDLSKML